MTDWTEKDTHDILTQHGYKKPANGPSYMRSYTHPEGHKIEIDRNIYKLTKANGEVTRGHVGNLPHAMRQLHPSKLKMMEVELDIYDSKEKNAADDKMTAQGIAYRFKNDTGYNRGDWGKAQIKYSPGPTYEEDNMAENFQLLRAVLLEAQSFEPVHTKHTEDPITDCAVCGKGNHVPAKHFGKALAGENNQPVKEDAAEKCPDCHKVHAPTVPCPAKKLLFSTEEEKYVKCVKCKQPFTYKPKDNVEMRNTCDSCNKKLSVKEETITETNKFTHKIWTGPSGVKQYAAALHKHYPNTKAGTEHVYVHTDHPAEHVASTLKNKLGMSGFTPGNWGWSTQEHKVQHNPKKQVKESMKFSREHDTPEQAEKHKQSLERQGVKAWVNRAPDGKHHTFWMQEAEQMGHKKGDKVKPLAGPHKGHRSNR
jgi:DNA-directed RNA polymerase subunit RPC12/RpoP